ncbi:unnamed protein product [Sympodiomycopsis kandeliae]
MAAVVETIAEAPTSITPVTAPRHQDETPPAAVWTPGETTTAAHSVQEHRESKNLSDDDVDNNNNAGSPPADETEYPKGVKMVLICVALCSMVFLVSLDQTIVSTAVPRISDEFNSFSQVGFYSSAYLLTSTAFQPLFGRFYGSFNVKWTFLAAFAIFELGSLICAIAPNSNTFIAGRAIAGLGLAGAYSGCLIIITLIAPLHVRPLLTSMVSGFYGIGACIGPIIGGAITSVPGETDNSTAASYRGWRWNFFLNLFFIPILLPVIYFFVKIRPHDNKGVTVWQRLIRIDWIGSFLVVGSVMCILLVFQWGGVEYAWGSSRIIGLIVGFVVIAAAFWIDQWYMGERATIPFSILKRKTIFGGSAVNFAVGATYFVELYFLPLYFQSVRGSSAIRSGVQTLPFIIAVIFAVSMTGGLVNKYGYYIPYLLLGSALMTAGGGALYTFQPDTSQAKWGGLQFLAGFGPGMVFMLPFLAASATLPPESIELGSAIVIFWQTLGGTISTSLSQSIFQNKFKLYLDSIPGISSAEVLSHGVSAFRETTPAEILPTVVAACNQALQKVWIIVIVLGGVSILTVFLMDLNGKVDVSASRAAEKAKKEKKKESKGHQELSSETTIAGAHDVDTEKQ